MANLKCTATNCCFNAENYCSKGDIMVGGKSAETCEGTCCDSFHARKEGDGCGCMKSSITHPSKNISIDCEADKCTYNSNYKCTADHVDIKGSFAKNRMETACATFKER